MPKGDLDIRVVYNGTASGLNEALWAPGFYLPNANAAARLLMFYSFTVDADLGEMFLNFPMDKKRSSKYLKSTLRLEAMQLR